MSEKFRKHNKGSNPIQILRHYKYEVKWAWQRVVKGHDDRDWYSIKDWFSDELEIVLLEMKENLHSYPPDMTFDEWKAALDHFYSTVKRFNEVKDDSPFKWATIQEYNIEYNTLKEEMIEMFELYFDDLWD